MFLSGSTPSFLLNTAPTISSGTLNGPELVSRNGPLHLVNFESSSDASCWRHFVQPLSHKVFMFNVFVSRLQTTDPHFTLPSFVSVSQCLSQQQTTGHRHQRFNEATPTKSFSNRGSTDPGGGGIFQRWHRWHQTIIPLCHPPAPPTYPQCTYVLFYSLPFWFIYFILSLIHYYDTIKATWASQLLRALIVSLVDVCESGLHVLHPLMADLPHPPNLLLLHPLSQSFLVWFIFRS